MAYQVTITKNGVSRVNNVVYSISMRVVINDGTDDVFDKTYSIQYNTNSADLETLKSQLLEAMQEDWDKYIAEKGINDSAAYDSAISDMQTTATAYVNS